MSEATVHRCGIHPCSRDAEVGHSTCQRHRHHEEQLHANYWAFRERLAAEDQVSLEEQEEARARRSRRVEEILAQRRAAALTPPSSSSAPEEQPSRGGRP